MDGLSLVLGAVVVMGTTGLVVLGLGYLFGLGFKKGRGE